MRTIYLLLFSIIAICSDHTENQPYYIKTLNNFGDEILHDNKFRILIKNYILNNKDTEKIALDIGSATGANSSYIVKNTNFKVHINDICEKALLKQLSFYTEEEKTRVFLNLDSFPYQTNFAPESIDVIILSNVIHYLSPQSLKDGLEKMLSWLKPGGKIFISALTPYAFGTIHTSQEIDLGKIINNGKYYNTYTKYIDFPYPQLKNNLESLVNITGYKIVKSNYFAMDYEIEDNPYTYFDPDIDTLFYGNLLPSIYSNKKQINIQDILLQYDQNMLYKHFIKYIKSLNSVTKRYKTNNDFINDYFDFIETIIHNYSGVYLILEK